MRCMLILQLTFVPSGCLPAIWMHGWMGGCMHGDSLSVHTHPHIYSRITLITQALL